MNTLKPSDVHWCVAGGGMLGLATALRLLDRGFRVTVLESSPELGGLTSCWKLGNVVWDKYYHVTLLSDSRLRQLLRDIQLEHEIEWVQTRTGFYSDGKLYSLSSSWEFLRFPPLSLLQKFRLGSTIFLASKIKNWRKLEEIPVEQWLRKWSGKRTFEKIWLPLLKAKLGEAYQRTSAAFIWSYIDRMYKARRSGMKKEMFGYVPGGYQRILKVLAKAITDRGGIIQTSAPVQQVESLSDGKISVACGREGNLQTKLFDRVIMTTPSKSITQACRQLLDDERENLERIEYLGVVCTSMLLDGPLGGYYVTNITDTWVPLTGIIEMGAIVDPKHLDGKYLVYLPKYLLSNDIAFDEPEEQIHERCLATLEKMYPKFQRDQVSAMQTAKARYVMALPTLKYSKSLPPVACSVPGLYLLNSAQITKGNLNVNETIELAEHELEKTIIPDHERRAIRG